MPGQLHAASAISCSFFATLAVVQGPPVTCAHSHPFSCRPGARCTTCSRSIARRHHIQNTLFTEPSLPHLQTRRSLYDMFSLYCEEAQTPGQFRNDLRRIVNQGELWPCLLMSRCLYCLQCVVGGLAAPPRSCAGPSPCLTVLNRPFQYAPTPVVLMLGPALQPRRASSTRAGLVRPKQHAGTCATRLTCHPLCSQGAHQRREHGAGGGKRHGGQLGWVGGDVRLTGWV